MEETMKQEQVKKVIQTSVVDCDVHVTVPSIKALLPYLSERWRDYIIEHDIKSLEPNYYPKGSPLTARPGSKPASGNLPGSDLGLLRTQLLEPWNTEYAIVNCLYGVQMIHNQDWAVAMAQAVNDWQKEEWLEKDDRLRASIVIPTQSPEKAAEEIHRLGQDPGFVQILMVVRSEQPYGKRHFWPIYEAAQQYNLPIGIHAGGSTGYPIMPVGWPTHYLEDYVSHAQAFQSQVISLISEGVFSKFPKLRVVLMEAGFTWVPSLMWRFDKNWKGLRREIPWVDRLPSEIIKEHFRFTTQPFDEPSNSEFLLDIIEQLGSEEMLLFSTDYPHWQYDKDEEAIPAGLSNSLEEKILSRNAKSIYRF
jgi:uncharacterized protein